jgi:hypothetical protein
LLYDTNLRGSFPVAERTGTYRAGTMLRLQRA